MSDSLELHYDCLVIQKHLLIEHGLEMSEADIRRSYSAFCEATWCAGWICPTAREIDSYYRWLNTQDIKAQVELAELFKTTGVF